MITAAMPPSTLSTTFLRVSANTFHLDARYSFRARRARARTVESHAGFDRGAAQGGEIGGAVEIARTAAVDDAVLRGVARVALARHRARRDRAGAHHVDVDLVADRDCVREWLAGHRLARHGALDGERRDRLEAVALAEVHLLHDALGERVLDQVEEPVAHAAVGVDDLGERRL